MRTVIIKYNAGNVQSVRYALERLGVTPELSDDEATIRAADRVIFPGVGEASTAMRYLRAKHLDQLLPTLQQPVLGICLGLQLMCTHSEENDTPCLGIFDVPVRRFRPSQPALKVPHMGWNTLNTRGENPLLAGIGAPAYVYFVHSYYAALGEHTAATCDYVHPFSAMLHRDNFYACQFHPEKSADVGARILENFVRGRLPTAETAGRAAERAE
ncbi:MAG: imidazole glycerol phosphate synthase subunit HisH [Catalinimonas sp.]